MAFSYTSAADPTYGFRFTSLTGSGVTINLADHRIGRVQIIQDPLGARVFSAWGGELMQEQVGGSVLNGQDLLLKLRLIDTLPEPDQDLFHFDLDCVVDDVNESMMITPRIAMQAPYAPFFAFHYCSYEIRIRPPGAGDPANCRIMIPGAAPFVVPWRSAEVWTGTSRNFESPAVSWKGGNFASTPTNPDTDLGIIKYDEPSGDLSPHAPAMHQCWYFYDETTKEGLLIRTNDIVGRGKVFGIQRDVATDDIIFHVRFVPQDNSTGINNLSDFNSPYGVELRPMVGDFNDAIEYDTQRKTAENHPALLKPTIKKNRNFSKKARNMVCFAPMWSQGPTQDFAKYIEQHKRIRDFFGGGSWSVGGVWYGTGPGDLGETAPDYGPVLPSAIEQLKVAHAEELSAIIYTIPINPNKDALQAIEPSLAIENDLVITRQNYVIVAEPGVPASLKPIETEHPSISASNGGTVFIAFDFTNLTNVQEYCRYITDQFVGLKIAGFYIDRGGADGPPANDNPALAAADRGIGSATWTPNYLNVANLMRDELEEDGGIIIHEWPSEFTIETADIVTWNSVGAAGVDTSQVAGPAQQYGERVKHSTFGGYGRGPHPDLGFDFPGIVSRLEWHNAVFSYWFMMGHMMPVQAFFIQRPDEYFIALEGEQDYDDWFAASLPHYNYLKRLWWKLREVVDRFHISKRLFEMPTTSIIKRKVDEACGQVFAEPLYIYSQGWYDPDADFLGFACVNWTLRAEEGGYANRTVDWNDTLTISRFPQLGNQVRDVYLIDAETGVRERLPDYDGGGTYQIPDIEMTPGRSVWLMMGRVYDDIGNIRGELRAQGTITGRWSDVPIENDAEELYAGESRAFDVVIEDAGTPLADHAVITEATAVASKDGDVLFSKSIANYGIEVFADKLRVHVDPADTQSRTTEGVFECQIWATISDKPGPVAVFDVVLKESRR